MLHSEALEVVLASPPRLGPAYRSSSRQTVAAELSRTGGGGEHADDRTGHFRSRHDRCWTAERSEDDEATIGAWQKMAGRCRTKCGGLVYARLRTGGFEASSAGPRAAAGPPSRPGSGPNFPRPTCRRRHEQGCTGSARVTLPCPRPGCCQKWPLVMLSQAQVRQPHSTKDGERFDCSAR